MGDDEQRRHGSGVGADVVVDASPNDIHSIRQHRESLAPSHSHSSNSSSSFHRGASSSPAGEVVAVRVRILRSIASINDVDCCRRRYRHRGGGDGVKIKRRGGRGGYIHDEHATAYYQVSGDVRLFGSIHRVADRQTSSSSSSSSSSSCDGATCCRLHRDMPYEVSSSMSSLWSPVILRPLPSKQAVAMNRTTGRGNDNDDDGMPNLYVPPCLAATLGIRGMLRNADDDNDYNADASSSMAVSYVSTGIIAYLTPMSTKYVVEATHATLREIGRPVPVPMFDVISRSGFVGDSGDDEDVPLNDMRERRLRDFFLRRPPSSLWSRPTGESQELVRSNSLGDDDDCNTDERRRRRRRQRQQGSSDRRRYKPRQRLLGLGAIFAVPNTANDLDCDSRDCEYDDPSMMMRDVRFYQIVDARCARTDAEDVDHCDDGYRDATIGDIHHATEGGTRERGGVAYIISPSTHMVLLPPSAKIDDDPSNENDFSLHPQFKGALSTMRGYALRLPHRSLTISFLRSVANELKTDDGTTDATTRMTAISDVAEETTTTNWGLRRHHPSANDIVDALYLNGAIPAVPSSFSSSFVRRRVVPHDGTYPRIIHVIGKEENNVRACIDEACDVS